VNTKKLAGAGVATISAVTAVTAMLLGSTAAVAQESGPDSAYALAATGALTIPPISFVRSTDGEQVENQLLGLGDVLGPEEDDLAAGLLTAEARRGAAETAVAEVNLLALLRADLVRTYCEDGRGGLQIINGSVLGQALPEAPVPGQTLDLSPLLTLSLNDQTRNADGSLTVTGIELTVLPGAEQNLDEELTSEQQEALPALTGLLGTEFGSGTDTVRDVVDQVTTTLGADLDLSRSLQTITVGSATCGSGGDDDGGDKGDGEDKGGSDESKDAPMAPAPAIVKADLPVTG
jgi:hypothetical protein